MEYRPGQLNIVVDALSRRDADDAASDAAALAILGPSFIFLDNVCVATTTTSDAQHLLCQLQEGTLGEPWRTAKGLLLPGSHIYILAHGDLCH